MRKTRTKVRANRITCADTCKAAKFAADDQHDKSLDIADNSEDETNIDSANIDLAEIGVYIKELFADSIRETCRRRAMEDYTNSSKIDVISILTTNLRAEISTNKEDSILIYHCQVDKIDGPNEGNINNMSEDTVALWQEMIRQGGHLADKRVNASNINDLCQITY